jgi:hypothetical protein
MGLIQDIISKIRNRYNEEHEELPDDVTRDKYLRSLRREDRVLDEEEEKEYLKRKIAIRRKIKLRKELFGIKDRIRRKQQINNNSFLGRYRF